MLTSHFDTSCLQTNTNWCNWWDQSRGQEDVTSPLGSSQFGNADADDRPPSIDSPVSQSEQCISCAATDESRLDRIINPTWHIHPGLAELRF